jgi:hypothetical protein
VRMPFKFLKYASINTKNDNTKGNRYNKTMFVKRYSWLERPLSLTTHVSSEPNGPTLRTDIKTVLETNAHLAFDVNPRPVREDVSGLKKLVTASPDVRCLLAFQTDPLHWIRTERKRAKKKDSPCPNRCFSSPRLASAKYP